MLCARPTKAKTYRDKVVQEDTTAQKKWLEQVLSDTSAAIKWKIVVGHHPAYTGGKRMNAAATTDIRYSFEPLFQKYKVHAFIAGHEHHLEHNKPAGFTHHFISGAGSSTRPVQKIPGIGKFSYGYQGFMSFSITAGKILVQVINYKGEIVYVTTISN